MQEQLIAPQASQDLPIIVFADEIKESYCPVTKSRWDYAGILLVKKDQLPQVLDELDKARYFQSYSYENDLSAVDESSNFFPKNDKVVHYNQLIADTYHIGSRWIDAATQTPKRDLFHFGILGINRTILSDGEFGYSSDWVDYYNRFFRVLVASAVKYHYPGKNVIIDDIYHERGNQQSHQLFPWHTIKKLEEDYGITTNCRDVSFLDSNHRSDRKANCLQFIDSTLGAIRFALEHNPNSACSANSAKMKCRLANDYLELVDRMVNKPRNVNSSFGHHRRCTVSFFPSREIKTIETVDGSEAEIKGGMYQERPIGLKRYNQDKDQISIFETQGQ